MADTDSSREDFLNQYDGQIVPRSFNAGFVALSFVVSFIGALSTLELINRRTALKGKFNHLLLMSSAVTMGGIAIWCMHYIGNRAIELANGEPILQIAYSSGFTALSFFIPILVLVVAFIATGTDDSVSWWRVTSGGVLAGTAICGMHYLGNASIYNYKCVYNPVNVVGAAIIAVAASIIALFMFFVFRAAWANTWWKRIASAVVLAGAVSGMHWCAATGTKYRLINIREGDVQLSRNSTVIIVICLSVGACFIMAATAIYTARMRKRYASKAQQVVLAAAVFDKQGRILVNPDGLLPSEMITDTFLEKNSEETFNTSHRLFHWMFQASRNWSGISPLIDGMTNHLGQLPRHGRDRDARTNIKLVSEHGELIDKYDLIFRELFCVAAVALAEKMKEHVSKVGILWDDILATGAGGSLNNGAYHQNHYQQQTLHPQQLVPNGPRPVFASSPASEVDSLEPPAKKSSDIQMTDLEKGQSMRKQEYGRGALMFLVREVKDDRDIDNLCAAGYRFAPLHQVSGIIASSMQIKSHDIETKLKDMSVYAGGRKGLLAPGVHLGFFGVRARVGSIGFDVLVCKEARNLLPSRPLLLGGGLDRLEPWHVDLLGRLDRMSVAAIERKVPLWKNTSARENAFANQLVRAIRELGAWVGDGVFNEATLTSRVVQLPRRTDGAVDGARAAPTSRGSGTPSSPAAPAASGPTSMVVLKMVIPIHVNVLSAHCDFIPLNFFKVHQLSGRGSPHHGTFVRSVHRELAPIINSVAVPVGPNDSSAARGRGHGKKESGGRVSGRMRMLRKGDGKATRQAAIDSDGNPIPTVFGRKTAETASNQSGSTLKLWRGPASDTQYPAGSGSSAYENAMPTSPDATAGNNNNNNGGGTVLGGIMVSQEITVDVHEEPPAAVVNARRDQRSRSRPRTTGMALPPGHQMGGMTNGGGAESGDDIFVGRAAQLGEETHMGQLHTGAPLQVANIEVERFNEVVTFVDELFAICIDR